MSPRERLERAEERLWAAEDALEENPGCPIALAELERLEKAYEHALLVLEEYEAQL